MTKIKIEYKPTGDENGEFNPNRRSIQIDGTMSESFIISTLLHELGHFVDISRNPKRWDSAHHYYGYGRLEKNLPTLTSKQKAIVWKCELEAWRNARGLARQLRIPLGKWFFDDERNSLNSYRSIKRD